MYRIHFFILTFNFLWFLAAFKTFALTPSKTTRMLRPDLPRDDEKTKLVVPTLPFLGGMNLALFSLNALSLYYLQKSFHEPLLTIVYVVSALAHATQFGFNLPHVRGLSKGAPWDVLVGPMKFIFIVDFLGFVWNAIGWILI